MGGRKKQQVGTRWSLGQHLVLCQGPVDSVDVFWFGEKEGWRRTAPSNGVDIERVKVNNPQLFGSYDQEGGVRGDVDIMLGKPTQPENDYLKRTFAKGGAISAFRHLVSLVFRQVYMGNSPYMPAVSAEVTRIKTGWDGDLIWAIALADTGNGLNAAHILHEVIECPEWGAGTTCNEAAFLKAAQTLKNEKFGLNTHWLKQQPVEEFVKEICRYINATVFEDETTGEVSIKLIRDDYDPAKIPVINDVVRVANVRRRSMADTVNTVTVTYTDPNTYKQASVIVRNSAMLVNSRKPVGKTIAYPMIHDAELAYQVAMRELAIFSTPFISGDIYTDTRYAHLQVGDVVKVVDHKSGLNHIFRVHSKRRGAPSNPQIRLALVEDIFSPTFGTYTPPPKSNWTKPNLDAVSVTEETLIDCPYWLLATTLTPSELKLLDHHSAPIIWMGNAPTQVAMGAEIWYSNTGEYKFSHRGEFSFFAITTHQINKTSSQLLLQEPISHDLPCLAVLGDELVRIDSQSGNVVTISRGMLDTLPATHVVSTKLFTLPDMPVGYEFEEGERVDVRALTVTGAQTLPMTDANTLTINASARQARPLPPCNVKLNGTNWTQSTTLPLTISWTSRARLSEVVDVARLTPWYAGVIPSESNVSLRVLDASGGAILSRTGLTSPVMLDAELAGHSEVVIELKTEEGGIDSYQVFSHTVKLTTTL